MQDFDAFSLVNWGAVAESHHRLSALAIQDLFAAAGLQTMKIAEKMGPGLALFAKSRKT